MDVRAAVKAFVVENFLFGSTDNSLGDADSFLESGIIDSTGILELVSFVEESFKIEVKDEELVPDNFDSIQKLVTYIGEKNKSQQTG